MYEGSALASIVMVVAGQGNRRVVVAVREPSKPSPIYWKLPGGMGELDESPQECAVRELFGETGVKVSPEDLKCFRRQDARSHTKYFFLAELSSLPKLAERGDEGEEVGTIPLQEVLRRSDFMPIHRSAIRETLEKLL